MVGVPAARAGQFHKAVYYNLGSNDLPRRIVAADFNHDGNSDLAIADYLSDHVSILLGKGDGTFRRVREFSVAAPFWIAAGDLNGDGAQDLIVAQSGGTGNGALAAFLGDGKGNFRAGERYQTGIETVSVAMADFDSDGNLDIAVIDAGQPGDAMVFLGTGKGTLKKPTTYVWGGTPWAVAAGDLNGDQHPDLAVTNINGSVSVLMNKGNGKFRKPRGYFAGGGEIVDVAIADLNHDGFADLVAANASLSSVAVLLNNGNGTFGSATLYPTSLPKESTGAAAVVVADFNLDGIPDIAAVNQLNNSALFYGKGNGKFKHAVPIKDGIDFQGGFSLAVGDFNNDQAPDLAIPIFDEGKVAIMLNTQ